MSTHETTLSLRWLVALSLFLTGVAFAGGSVSVSGAWVRLLPANLPLAGYFTLHNGATEPIKLVGAKSPAFQRIEMHHSMSAQGMDKMMPVPVLTVPPGGEIRFAPAGYHLMMWGADGLQVGDRVPITLQLADGTTVTVSFTVKGAAP